MPHLCKGSVVALAAIASVCAAQAQETGWNTGYQMGTSWAGVSAAQKVRFTVYCGDSAAAKANPAIAGGPYLTASLPKLPGMEAARSLEVVINGRATSIPVQPRPDGEMVELSWKPGRDFGVSRMKPVLAAMRKASTIELRAAGQSTILPTNGAGKALADYPLGCK